MHRVSNFKIVTAQQSRVLYNYRNTKQKLFKTDATICFNKMCRINPVILKYVHIKVNRL